MTLTDTMQSHLVQMLQEIEEQVRQGNLPQIRSESKPEVERLLVRTVQTCLALARRQARTPRKPGERRRSYPTQITAEMRRQVEACCHLIESRRYLLSDQFDQQARERFQLLLVALVNTCLSEAAAAHRRPRKTPAQLVPARPRIVCLCGSTRFASTFHEANLRETLAGRIVLSIGVDTKSDADLLLAGPLTPEDKARLDELHLRKIDLADEILVLNIGGYLGDSTRQEIAYAQEQGKPIRWWEPPAPLSHTEGTGESAHLESAQQPTPCAAENCSDTGMFLCCTCHHLFCLRHIIDLNEDGRYGEEPISCCVQHAPWNEQGGLDLPAPYHPDEEE